MRAIRSADGQVDRIVPDHFLDLDEDARLYRRPQYSRLSVKWIALALAIAIAVAAGATIKQVCGL